MKMFWSRTVVASACVCCNLLGMHDCITDIGNSPDGTLQVAIANGRVSVYNLAPEQSDRPVIELDGDIATFGHCGYLLAVWKHGADATRLYDAHTWQQLQAYGQNGVDMPFRGKNPIFSGDGTAIALFSRHALFCYKKSVIADSYQMEIEIPFDICIVHGDVAFLSHNQKTAIFDIWSNRQVACALPGEIRRVRADGLLVLCESGYGSNQHYYIYRTHDGKIVAHGQKQISHINLDDFSAQACLEELSEGLLDPLCQ